MLLLSDCCIFIESVSFRGGGRGGGFNTLIYTSKPPWHRIVLREEGRGAEGGGKGNEGGLYFLFTPPAWAEMEVYEDGTLML